MNAHVVYNKIGSDLFCAHAVLHAPVHEAKVRRC